MTENQNNFNHNEIIYSVSDISQAIKRMVEDRFATVKLRGEISGYKLASSGHAYFRLKDENAVLDAVMWRGTLSKLKVKPEDGVEVVATGKLTTYPGKSSYQMVVDAMEPAGAGALMALLEKRRVQLEAEGLFAASRKKALPYLPQCVGVVTSPTGAVIRDILHRISDRFPCHVLVWPVAVQGEGAAEQIAAAIAGFNALAKKPDVLIVARGGGSLEDLWAFNEEIVVRAAAASKIPLISAVGHETDTTLIDYAADMRAPTPTAAADIVVPVLMDLKLSVSQLNARLLNTMHRQYVERRGLLEALLRGLPRPTELLQHATQRLDDWGERLEQALPAALMRREQRLAVCIQGLKPHILQQYIAHQSTRLTDLLRRCQTVMLHRLDQRNNMLDLYASKLEHLNVQRVLERGFALVRGDKGQLITRSDLASQQAVLEIQFADGRIRK